MTQCCCNLQYAVANDKNLNKIYDRLYDIAYSQSWHSVRCLCVYHTSIRYNVCICVCICQVYDSVDSCGMPVWNLVIPLWILL